jgi:bifunctional oligoribonuclease and PAP phosphatase NrnA
VVKNPNPLPGGVDWISLFLREKSEAEAELARGVAAIGASDTLALACHVTPDGDALGSMMALHHLAVANGRTVTSSWPTPFVVAANYRSVPGLDQCVAPETFPEHPGLMVTFDCGALGRLGELATPARWAAANSDLVVVDHHVTNERFGSVNIIDPGAAATAVVVREIARGLGWELNRDAALCLYVALIADTGRFQYSSTTASVFGLAEELASFDLPIATVSRQLFSENRFAYLQLASVALARAELDADLGFVHTSVTLDDQRTYDVSYDEVEGLIEWVRSTAEAEVACVCKETDDGIRVSLRSVELVDVGSIAHSLGGGGHRLAGGFTMRAPIDEVVRVVKERVAALVVRRPE